MNPAFVLFFQFQNYIPIEFLFKEIWYVLQNYVSTISYKMIAQYLTVEDKMKGMVGCQ